MKPIPLLLAFLSLGMAGCDSGPKVAKEAAPPDVTDAVGAALPIVPEEVVSQWGFRTVAASNGKQSAWEAGEFGKAKVRAQSIKAVEEAPRREDTYYRFTLVEETLADEATARSRFARLKDHDPQLNSKQHAELILRDGFSAGDKVFYVTTDVSAFEIEKLPEMVRMLKSQVLGGDKEH